MEKFVVENGGCQTEGVIGVFNRGRLNGALVADQSPLAQYVAVFLAGDFFRHLEDHFNQRICRQLLRTEEQDAGLADVLDLAFVPGAEIFSAVANREVGAQAAGTRHPGRLLFAGPAADGGGLRHWLVDFISATHGLPVVLVRSGAHQTDLIILSIGRAAGP